jgi:hypothetical protein
MVDIPTALTRSLEPAPRRPVLRALHPSGQGFWEIDLLNGTAWFSPWIHAVLGAPRDGRHASLSAWRALLSAADWDRLLNGLRAVLETNSELDLEVELEMPALGRRTWHVQGRADPGSTHLPVHLSGSMRDVTDQRPAAPAPQNSTSGAVPTPGEELATQPARPLLRGI